MSTIAYDYLQARTVLNAITGVCAYLRTDVAIVAWVVVAARSKRRLHRLAQQCHLFIFLNYSSCNRLSIGLSKRT